MPTRARTQPDLADVVALARALERDEQRPAGDIAEWERTIARGLPLRSEHRELIALAWLDGVESEDDAIRRVHQHADSAVRLTSFLIVLAGAVLGWGATLGAFYFDGSGRVNAVLAVAVLVVVPALLILPFAVAALPARLVSRVPGAGVLSALARAFSAGRLAPLIWRAFPRELRDALALVSGRMEKHRRLYAALQKWALLRWSQLFAVAFQLTALGASLILVVFTDLAFGWSTTLTTGDAARDARRMHAITTAISSPWSWAVPDARPSLAMIEESRYYRVASDPVSREQAARLGGWWPFIVMSMAVYGLLPRLLTLTLAQSRLRAAARAVISVAPGVSALVRRMHRAQIETEAIEPEPAETGRRVEAPSLARGVGEGVGAVITWSDVPVDENSLSAAFPGAPRFAAGGGAAIADDAATTRRVNETLAQNGAADIVILVKAWEPPVMEFVDFVALLRESLSSKATTISVLPLGLDADARLGGATALQLKVWRDKLGGIGDPWLRVAADRVEAQR